MVEGAAPTFRCRAVAVHGRLACNHLGYELSSEIETRLVLPPSPDSVIALAIRTPAAWIRDRATGQAWLVAEPGADVLLDAFENHVRESAAPSPAAPSPRAHLVVREEDPARFLESVSRALDYIAAGDVYQTNLSRQWQVRSDRSPDPVSIYERLRSTNPSPFAAMMRYGEFSLMSSSPERLLSISRRYSSRRDPSPAPVPAVPRPEMDAALRGIIAEQ